MASARFILALILFASSINQYKGSRLQDHFYLDYMICKFNPMLAVNATCKTSFITRLQKSLSVSGVVVHPIDNFNANFKLHYKFRSGYKPLLIDLTYDLCYVVRVKPPHLIMMNFILSKVQAYSAKNLTCPYQGIFNIHDMPINLGIVDNIFLPAGNYMLNITTRVKKEFFWNAKVYFILPEGKTVEDDRMG